MKLFTLEEANEMIPRCEILMERLQRLGLVLRAAAERAAVASVTPAEEFDLSAVAEVDPEIRTTVDSMESLVREIHELGGHFKGLELGLVDFAAEIDGKVGFLCWQYGEKEITHWHPTDSGFANRRPLPGAVARHLN